MNLSDNLKRIRKENNLSQEQLADKLGVSRQSVSKWESGQAYPEMDKVLQLCQLFNLNIDELLNQNIKDVNNKKQAKNTFNKFLESALDYLTRVYKMLIQLEECEEDDEEIRCIDVKNEWWIINPNFKEEM